MFRSGGGSGASAVGWRRRWRWNAQAVDYEQLLRQWPQEDVHRVVAIAPHEVGGERLEGNRPAVGRDRRLTTERVGVAASLVDAGAGGRGADEVAHEDVGLAVGVARDEVGRVEVALPTFRSATLNGNRARPTAAKCRPTARSGNTTGLMIVGLRPPRRT